MSSEEYLPFKNIINTEMEFLIYLIKEEHPQVIALILSFFDNNKVESILKNLSEELQNDVRERIENTDQQLLRANNYEIPCKIEQYLEKKIKEASEKYRFNIGGVECAAEILSQIGTDSNIIYRIEKEIPEIEQKIQAALERRKKIKDKKVKNKSVMGSGVTQADTKILLKILLKEHPQITALILSFLDPEKTADILWEFNFEKQCDMIMRIACMRNVNTEIIRRVYKNFEKNIRDAENEPKKSDSVKSAVKILNQIGAAQTAVKQN